MMLILIMAVYLFLQAEIDWAAGICFSLLFIRPNPILLVFPVLWFWAIFNRRYRFILSSLVRRPGTTGWFAIGQSSLDQYLALLHDWKKRQDQIVMVLLLNFEGSDI